MVHAALLLLMLEAANADLVFTISLKRSTPNLQLSTNSPADYPIFGSLATELRCRAMSALPLIATVEVVEANFTAKVVERALEATSAATILALTVCRSMSRYR